MSLIHVFYSRFCERKTRFSSCVIFDAMRYLIIETGTTKEVPMTATPTTTSPTPRPVRAPRAPRKPAVFKKGWRAVEKLFNDKPFRHRGATCP